MKPNASMSFLNSFIKAGSLSINASSLCNCSNVASGHTAHYLAASRFGSTALFHSIGVEIIVYLKFLKASRNSSAFCFIENGQSYQFSVLRNEKE